jgi:hypothetical protein
LVFDLQEAHPLCSCLHTPVGSHCTQCNNITMSDATPK